MAAKGPGKGRLKALPTGRTIYCALCGDIIVSERAIARAGGRWEHQPERWGGCPRPYYEEEQD